LGRRPGVKSALGISPETTDFVTEVAASNMLEIHRAIAAARGKEGAAFANHLRGDHTKTPSQCKPLQQSMLQSFNG
jgi:predicted outer membrane protein